MTMAAPCPTSLGRRLRRGVTFASFVVAVSVAVAHPPLAAAPAPTPTRWSQLSPQQREALAPLEGDWNELTPVRQQRWIRFADRYPELKPEEQQRVQERLRGWVGLSTAERRAARESYVQSRNWTPEQRQRAWDRYSNLPPAERDALAEDARKAKAAAPAGSAKALPAPAAVPAPARGPDR